MERQIKTEINFYQILQELVFPHGLEKGIFSVKQIAEIVGLQPSTTYARIESGKFTAEEFILLARAFAARGEFAFSNMVVPEGYSLVSCKHGEVNGSLADEYKEMVQDLGQIGTSFDKKDKRGAMRLLPRVKDVLFDIEQEVIAL